MINKCVDCNKPLSRKDALRCHSCATKYRYDIIGRKIFRCKDCNKIISYGHKRCAKCNKKYQIGENASNWKNVKYNCIDCNKKLANIYAKRCQSCSSKGKRNSHFGIKPKHSIRIHYKHICFRSSWEANFAKWCDGSGIKWNYESKIFDLGNTTYTPDFYLPQFDLYIEIKGYWFPENLKKFNLFKQLYPKINIKVFNKVVLQTYSILK